MYLSKDPCAKCLNIDNCEYRGKYVCSLFKLTEFLAANKKDVEWYGTLRATCDYFVNNPETDVPESCLGGLTMNYLDFERLYERAADSYKDRKFLYLFPRPDGSTWNAVNYDATNAELNVFLRNFEVWGSNGGQHKISEDGNHQEVWFEVSSDFVKLFEVNAVMLKAVGRMGVQVVYDYPFFNKSATENYQKIGQAWNEQYRYRDEEEE